MRPETADVPPAGSVDLDTAVAAFETFLEAHPRRVVLTGAGVSTESGIPDYRDAEGAWKRRPPVQIRDFLASEHGRRRYWARSLRGFPLMDAARPGAAHRWLAAEARSGGVDLLVTQNVDGLHGRAGVPDPLELHGSIHRVVCLDCGARSERAEMQRRLETMNPTYAGVAAEIGPDGDADLDDAPLDDFLVPGCESCGGMLKPDVVFFGESVPRARVDAVRAALAEADALVCIGTSLMVFSGFRFCRDAAAAELPIASVNLGRTRADDLLSLRLNVSCGGFFEALERRGAARSADR